MRSKNLVSFILGSALAACTASPTNPQADPSRAAAMPEAPPVPQTRYLVSVRPDDPSLGGSAPLVTVVVFSDYACPPCGRTWKVLDHLLEDYGDDLRVVARSLTVPGFGDGERAAEAALAAGAQGQFWPMHRRLFEGQLDRATLKAHAEALGLDVPRFLDDLDLGAFSGPRVQHRREAVELGIYFGPVALVNGRPVVGFRDERAWHDLIDEEILAAQVRLRDGTPRADLYASFQAGAPVASIELEPEAEAARQQLAKRFAVDIKTLPADFQRIEAGKRYMVEAGDAPALGPVDAPVQLVVFMDFECPYCRRAAQEAFQELHRRYPEDLRLAFRHLPLPIHRSADGAARAAAAADRQGQFWPFAHRLLAPEVTSLGRGTFLAIARDLHLDEARFIADLDGPDVIATVREDMLLARRLGLDATPGFFVNGRHVSGFHDVDKLAAEIDAELLIVKKLRSEGLPPTELLPTLLSREAVQFPNADQ